MLWFRAPKKVYFGRIALPPVALNEVKTVLGKTESIYRYRPVPL